MINAGYTFTLIVIAAVVTILLRAFPFIIFNGKKGMSPVVKKIADALPPAIIAVLVIYCLKDNLVIDVTKIIPALAAVAAVVAVHLYKRNTLISVLVGTIVYMLLIRVI